MSLVMKNFLLILTTLAFANAAQAENEVWYDWKGQPLGALPAESPGKVQPHDLVKNDQALIPVVRQPWHTQRRHHRLSDWYYDDYRYLPRYSYSHPFHCGATSLPQWRSALFFHGTYRSLTVRSQGFSLYWRR